MTAKLLATVCIGLGLIMPAASAGLECAFAGRTCEVGCSKNVLLRKTDRVCERRFTDARLLRGEPGMLQAGIGLLRGRRQARLLQGRQEMLCRKTGLLHGTSKLLPKGRKVLRFGQVVLRSKAEARGLMPDRFGC